MKSRVSLTDVLVAVMVFAVTVAMHEAASTHQLVPIGFTGASANTADFAQASPALK